MLEAEVSRLRAELQRRQAVVERLQAERLASDKKFREQVARAEEEVQKLHDQLSQSLGIYSSPVERRRERVLKLLQAGHTWKDIADTVGTTVPTVKTDAYKLRTKGVYPVPLRSPDDEESRRRNHVARIWSYFNVRTVADVHERLTELDEATILADLRWLSKNGYVDDFEDEIRLVSSSSETPDHDVPPQTSPDTTDHHDEPRPPAAPPSPTAQTPPAPAPPPPHPASSRSVSTHASTESPASLAPNSHPRPDQTQTKTPVRPATPHPPGATPRPTHRDPDDEDDAALTPSSSQHVATSAELAAEVKRRQVGRDNWPVTLRTSVSSKHAHDALVDSVGDGQTTPDASGHCHKVSRFCIMSAHKHVHDFMLPQ